MIGDNPWLDGLLRLLVIAVAIPLAVIVLNYLERKVIGRVQNRLGPMRVGPYGTLQAVADTIKLLTKEDVRPHSADRWTFELAPYVVVVPTVVALVTLPLTDDLFVRNLALGLFFILAVSTLSIVGLVMAGWGSDNKYAILGAMRSAAQLISYEIPLVMAAVAVAMVAHTPDGGRGSLDLVQLVDGQGRVPYIVWQPLAFFIFTVAALAELYRQPFDIPVAESEVVGGPFVEYSGMRWAMFMMAEYVNLVLLSALTAIVFLGGWNWPLGNEVGPALQVPLMAIKTALFILFFFWARAILPRLRIDQLMAYSWQVLLPLAFYQIIANGLVLVYDWPDVVLGVLSGAGAVAAMLLTYRMVRRPAPVRRPLAVAAASTREVRV
ncbi:MAG TPA: NADH-quinone oxidoreductase subunit NuoH [Dehalococcoidia bacterium]|nr:NADH-quinone oxidoreductase subunit NuoH [Dehalococcoidia bacterium]